MLTRLTASILAYAFAAACTPPSNTQAIRLADLVPVVDQGVSTDIILPPFNGSESLLGAGWEDVRPEQTRQDGIWIVGTTGSFRFYAAVQGSSALEAEATVLQAPGVPQVLELELNGTTVHRETMTPQWQRYQLPLPAEAVRIGWNDVTFRFARAVRPHDVDPDSSDLRGLTARFRRLSVRSPFERGVWAERPSAVEVTRTAADRADALDMAMPTDSTLDFYVLPQGNATLSGSVDAAVADRSGTAQIWGSIELVEETGETHQLLEFDHNSSQSAPEFELDLRPWDNRPVRLQFRAWGRANGTVRWSGVTLSTRRDPTVSEFTQPGHLAIPPVPASLGDRTSSSSCWMLPEQTLLVNELRRHPLQTSWLPTARDSRTRGLLRPGPANRFLRCSPAATLDRSELRRGALRYQARFRPWQSCCGRLVITRWSGANTTSAVGIAPSDAVSTTSWRFVNETNCQMPTISSLTTDPRSLWSICCRHTAGTILPLPSREALAGGTPGTFRPAPRP